MENLGIDLKLLIAQIVNFLLFFFIFKKFVAGPFMKFLDAQKNKEREKEKTEEDILQKRESWTKEEQKLKIALKKESDKIIKQTKDEAERLKEEILTKAKKDAEGLKEKAKGEIEEMQKASEKQIEAKIMELSIVIVEKALRNYLTDTTRKELTQHMLKNLSKEN